MCIFTINFDKKIVIEHFSKHEICSSLMQSTLFQNDLIEKGLRPANKTPVLPQIYSTDMT